MKLSLAILLLSVLAFADETFTFSYDFDSAICRGLADSACTEPVLGGSLKSVLLIDDGSGVSSGEFSETKTFEGIDVKVSIMIENDGTGIYHIQTLISEITAMGFEMPVSSTYSFSYTTSVAAPIVVSALITPYFSGTTSDIGTATFLFPLVYVGYPNKKFPFKGQDLKRFR